MRRYVQQNGFSASNQVFLTASSALTLSASQEIVQDAVIFLVSKCIDSSK